MNYKPPSDWVRRFHSLIRPSGNVLDLACGSGRHTHFFLDKGFFVTAVDREIDELKEFSSLKRLEILKYDIEGSEEWPFSDRTFDGVIVVNYLYRPIFPKLSEVIAKDGLLIYQTFFEGNEVFGRPRNPDFLLKPNELLDVFGNKLKIICFEQGYVNDPSPAMIQGICCRKE